MESLTPFIRHELEDAPGPSGPPEETSSMVSPPLGAEPGQPPVTEPPKPGHGSQQPPSQPDGPDVQLPPPEVPQPRPDCSIPMTDGTPAACRQKNAAEYLASEGNRNVIFCLRGLKSHMGDPHRNLLDFGHVPVVKRLTRMPVGIDPSHSVGTRHKGPDQVLDIFHATAQGIIAGANLVLIDFHPDPANALVDGAQALTLDELPIFLEDVRIARDAYLERCTRLQRAVV